MTERMESLEARIEKLEMEVQALRGAFGKPLPPVKGESHSVRQTLAAGEEDSSEELLSWVGKSSLLPRVSTLCFLLVVALVLRTVTDNDLLDKQVGSLIGMAYAAVLISLGGFKYSRKSPLAPVFATCGAILMYSIVLETHAHFESLPSVPAYVLLMVTGIGMASISYFHHNAIPVMVGTLGMGVAAVAIDYPNPFFPYVALMLLAANLLGAFATRLQRCSWLRWILLFLTALVLQVWGIKLGIKLGQGQEGALVALGLGWYLPVVALFALVYLGTAVLAVFRSDTGRVSKFDLALPTMNLLWSVPSLYYVARVGWIHPLMVGFSVVAGAGALFGIAALLVRLRGAQRPGVVAFVFAGTTALGFGLPFLTGGVLAALTGFSLAALGLALLSSSWKRGAIRAISYLLQVSGGLILAYVVLDAPPGENFTWTVIAGGALTIFGLVHFRWCRRNETPAASKLFGKWDPEDKTAVLVLLSSLASGFFLFRAGLYEGLLHTQEVIAPLFQGGESVIINAAAAGLLLYSFGRRDKELRNVAILVTLVGAGKVFLFDLFRISGISLVASVFSFGLAISLISVALTRWQKLDARERGGREEVDGPLPLRMASERRREA